MSRIHPSAIIDREAQIADDAEVGPWCFVRGKCIVGPGSVLISHVNLQGPLTVGAKTVCYPGVCLGFAPQDLGFPPHKDGAGLFIGDGNTFREGVTVHRGKTDSPTRIGNNNYWMANSHLGHDGVVGSNCVFGNGTLLGGHVEVGDRVIFGGNAGVHQFVRIGRGAFLSGGCGLTMDLPAWFTLTATNYAATVNVVGLRRSGAPRETIDTVRWVYRTLCRENRTVPNATAHLSSRQGDPVVDEYLAFIASAKRGICLAHGRRSFGGHGQSAAVVD
ncbi:MAG: acyl-ACP--UDP-N-acetylglucosamine O-acyltransferase [Phycisphaerales bacterium]|nr:acyl-ACP--UDP-N-acetylglucosamine O-acyltransferase [Phycisphaerales bacterium]